MGWDVLLQEISLCSLFLAGFPRSLFTFAELVIFSFTLVSLKTPLFFSAFFTFITPFSIQDTVSLPVSLGFDPVEYFSVFFGYLDLWQVLLVFLCVCFLLTSQILAYRLGNKNLARKNFHFFLFLGVLVDSRLFIHIGNLVVYLCAVLCKTPFVRKCVGFLVKDKESEKDCFSHLILVFTIFYTHSILNAWQHTRLCITVCVLDSVASIVGISLGRHNKSVIGLISGVAVSCIVEWMLLGTIDVVYHISMGILEYKCVINDNIALAFASVMYQSTILLKV